MSPEIPIKKSPKQIKSYLKHGSEFGSVLYQIYKDLKQGLLFSGNEIEKKFKYLSQKYNLTVDYPFKYEVNRQGKTYGSSICVSANDKIAHCRPTNRKFKTGDIISVDFGWKLDRLNYDAAFTVEFNTKNTSEWIKRPQTHVLKFIDQEANTTSISASIQEMSRILLPNSRNLKVKSYNYSSLDIVTALAGHGIGEDLHEAPKIHNAVGQFTNIVFFDGLVFCVEPIYVLKKDSTGQPEQAQVYIDSDGWTVRTINKQPSTHWETMFCVHNNQLIDLVGISKWEI